jgi:hypothetical protein
MKVPLATIGVMDLAQINRACAEAFGIPEPVMAAIVAAGTLSFLWALKVPQVMIGVAAFGMMIWAGAAAFEIPEGGWIAVFAAGIVILLRAQRRSSGL